MGHVGESDDERPSGRGRTPRSLAIEHVRGQHLQGEHVQGGQVDPRALAAWRSWLGALASDAEAALAAAMAYASLSDDVREAWLDALDADAAAVAVPRVALYAPLLAVELDDARRARMTDAIGPQLSTPRAPEALRGLTASGDCVCVVLSPVYLDFVELLICRYRPDEGIVSAHHDPLRHVRDASRSPLLEPDAVVELSAVPLRVVVEELAHAVVADRRQGRAAPAELAHFSHLFAPDLEREVPA